VNFWNHPLEAQAHDKAKALVKTLPARRCACGNLMRPISVDVRSFLYLTAKYHGATYRCTFFCLRGNNKMLPEVKDSPANVKFVVGCDGSITEVRADVFDSNLSELTKPSTASATCKSAGGASWCMTRR
jgi:hypothetical protein